MYNSYDCRTCRESETNVNDRVCFFDRTDAVVWKSAKEGEDQVPYSVDPELLISLLDEPNGSILFDLRRWSGDGSKEVCFVPLITNTARMLMSQEADAREYGIGSVTSKPLSARKASAFRILRSERATIQSEAMERTKRDSKGGGRMKPGRR